MSDKSFFKSEWPIILLAVLPIPILVSVWSSIPEIIPTHYNLHNQVDGYGSKSIFMGIIPGINLLMWALLYFIPRIDPKQQISANSPGYRALRVMVAGLFFVIFLIMLAGAMGKDIDMGRSIMAVVMLLFVGLGFYMPKLKPNYFAGIRLPWTLEDPENWRLTHIVGGKVAMIGGGVGFILVLLLPPAFAIVAVMLCSFALVVIPSIYSYRLYKSARHKM